MVRPALRALESPAFHRATVILGLVCLFAVVAGGSRASASGLHHRPIPHERRHGKHKHHKKQIIGAVVRVTDEGSIDYKGDDAYKETTDCGAAPFWDPGEEHHQTDLNWRSVYPHVVLSTGSKHAKEFRGHTKLTKSTYAYRGFGFVDTDGNDCSDTKVTYDCSGSLILPGSNNALASVVLRGEFKLGFYSYSFLRARPANCYDSMDNVAGDVNNFTQTWGKHRKTIDLRGAGGYSIATKKVLKLAKSGGKMREGATFAIDPANCSQPDDPGHNFKNDQCSQSGKAQRTETVQVIKAIRGHR